MPIVAKSHLFNSPSESNSSHSYSQLPVDMSRVATIILGGGQGSRLFPLTRSRCKPALSYGGRHRLIDIPISNAINSGCSMIYILTQFLSNSLHQHISSTYRFSSFSSGFIRLLSVEEKPEKKVWFQGTADAVRQSIEHFMETPADYFLILSGDQLYHMDYRKMVSHALETNADAVISCLLVDEADAKRMGVMQTDKNQLITDFHEKPQSEQDLLKMRYAKGRPEFLASMGIYLFKRQVLFDLLSQDSREDFGKHLIPTQVAKGNVSTYIHKGYWEDIGTISSFYHANIALTDPIPPFNCYNEEWRTFASPTSLPGPRVYGSHIDRAVLCEGAIVDDATITRSIIGPRTIIKKGTTIDQTYILGHDFYTPPVRDMNLPVRFEIGMDCDIHRAIIDKHAQIGNNVRLVNKDKRSHYDSELAYIRDGIIVIPRGVVLPDGFIL